MFDWRFFSPIQMESILQQLDHLSALEEKEKQQLKKVEHKIELLESETKEGQDFRL
jgi:hypothetical protein